MLPIVGFCCVEENELGPVHKYPVPPPEERFSALPVHTGLLLAAVAMGRLFTVTTVAVELLQPLLVTVTEYVPAEIAAALAMEGLC